MAQKLTLATSFSAGVAQVDAAADGRLSIALMLEHWAFAAEFLAATASTAFSARFGAIINVNQDAVLDGLALEVASAQQEPALVAAY